MVMLPFDRELLKLVYIFFTIPLLSWWPSPTTGNQCWSTPPTCRCASTLGVDSFEVPAVADLDAINQCNLSAKLEKKHNSTRNRRAWCSTHLKHICQNWGWGRGSGWELEGVEVKISKTIDYIWNHRPVWDTTSSSRFRGFPLNHDEKRTWENTQFALVVQSYLLRRCFRYVFGGSRHTSSQCAWKPRFGTATS